MAKKGNKVSRAFVGDFILTKLGWKPSEDGLLIDLGESRIKGIVVSRKGNFYGIRIGPGFTFTDHLDGLLGDPEGVMIDRKDFDLVKEIAN